MQLTYNLLIMNNYIEQIQSMMTKLPLKVQNTVSPLGEDTVSPGDMEFDHDSPLEPGPLSKADYNSSTTTHASNNDSTDTSAVCLEATVPVTAENDLGCIPVEANGSGDKLQTATQKLSDGKKHVTSLQAISYPVSSRY